MKAKVVATIVPAMKVKVAATYSEGGGGSTSNTCHKGWGCKKETKGEATKVENECWLPWIA